jgi:7-carboxy-7-deazaguanine synthase
MLNVNEIFYSFQGEGKSIGKPALFIRLNGCNLDCSYCDTSFTWKKGMIEESARYTPLELSIKVMDKLSRIYPPLIVFTGGEPLLHEKEILEFIDLLPNFYQFEIETNGTIFPELIYDRVYSRNKLTFNVSPKLNNSGVSVEKRYKKETLMRFNSLIENTTFKFVVQNLVELEEIRKDFRFIPVGKVIIMPEGVTGTKQLVGMQILADKCLEYGFSLVPRLQILIWENKRGV